MNICKGLNTSFYRLFQFTNRISLRKVYHGLNIGKQILATVLCFPSQCRDLLLFLLPFRNVMGDLRRSDNFAFAVFNWRNC